MALCRAVMPSSLAAEGLGTSRAVFLTSSNSPSKDASKSRAKGSKLILRDLDSFSSPDEPDDELGFLMIPGGIGSRISDSAKSTNCQLIHGV